MERSENNMVIGAITGIVGGKEAKKAAKKQKKIARQVQEESQLQSDLSQEDFQLQRAAVAQQRRQDRIQSIREARIRRAAILSQATASGMGRESSGLTGAVGALQSQFASTVGISNIFTRLQEESANKQSQIMASQGRVAQLQGELEIVQANLAKSQANINMWGGVAQGVFDIATAAFAPTRGTQFGSPQFFSSLFGGNKTPDIRSLIFED